MTRIVQFFLMVIASCGISNGVSGQNIPEKFREMFPYCRIGEDKNGAGVYYAPFGAWKFADLAENGTAEEQNAFAPWEEELIRVFKEDGGTKGEGVIVVVDCGGSGEFTPEAAKFAGKMYDKDAAFSRVIRKLLVINSGMSELKISLLRGYSKELTSHTEIYGNDPKEWEPQLLRRIPEDVLPTRLGGTNAMPELCNKKETRQKVRDQTSLLRALLG